MLQADENKDRTITLIDYTIKKRLRYAIEKAQKRRESSISDSNLRVQYQPKPLQNQSDYEENTKP